MLLLQVLSGLFCLALSARPPGFSISAKRARLIQLAVRGLGIAWLVAAVVSIVT